MVIDNAARRLEFWTSVVEEVNASDGFREKARALVAQTVLLVVEEAEFSLELHRGVAKVTAGSSPQGWTVEIFGDNKAWQKLVIGDQCFGEATNCLHGGLKVRGDSVAFAWASPALWEVSRKAQIVYREDERYA